MDLETAVRGAIEEARQLTRPEAEDGLDETAKTVAAFVREVPVIGLEWLRVVQAVARREGEGHVGNLTDHRGLRLIGLAEWQGLPHDRVADAEALHARAVAIFGDAGNRLDEERIAAFHRALPNAEPWECVPDGVPPMIPN